MRKAQLVALLLGAVLSVLGVVTLVGAEALAGFLAGVFLVLLSLPCFVIGGAIGLGRSAARVVDRTLTEQSARKVERFLLGRPRVTYEELRGGLALSDEALTRALQALIQERVVVEDFDAERGAFVYGHRPADAEELDMASEPAAPPPDAPSELVSVRERVRRLDRSRQRA